MKNIFKKFARNHKSQLFIATLGAIGIALVDRHYHKNYICVLCANGMIADAFDARNGNFQTGDGFYDVFQFEKL